MGAVGLGQHNGKRTQCFEVVALDVRHAHDDLVTAVAVEEEARWSAAERRRDGIGNFFHGQPVTRDAIAVEFDIEARETLGLSDSQIRDTTDFGKHSSDSSRGRVHHTEIVAINRNHHLATCSAEELVKPHLNWLGYFIEISNN